MQHNDGKSEKSDEQGGEAAQSDCDINLDNSAPLAAVRPDAGYLLNNGTSRPGEPGHSKYRTGAQADSVQEKQPRPRSRAARRREKRKTRRKRPLPGNSLAKGGPRVVYGVVCLLSSKLYTLYGSIGTATNALKPYRIAIDTCSGYNLVRRDCLPPDWRTYQVRNASLPRLAGEDSSPMKITAVVRLAVRLGNVTYRLPSVVADSLAVEVLLGTSFIDAHVRRIDVDKQCLELRRGRGVAIVDAKSVASSHGETITKPSRRTRNDHGRETVAQPIRLANWISIPPMSQLGVRVTTKGLGLVFLEPKPSLQHRHGVRLTNGVADVLPNRPFEVIVANVSRKPRRLPKNTILVYAKRNPVAILTPERPVAEEMGRVLNISALPETPSTMERSNYEGESDPAAEHSCSTKERVPDDWESHVSLSHIKDEPLRAEIMAVLRKHSSMWDGNLGTISATEHRIELEEGTKPLRSIPYRQGPAMRTKVAEEIEKMLNAGVMEPATSEWASPVVLVPKKDGSLRFCVDYRRLNTKTLGDAYPLPRMDDCIDSLGDARMFSTLDCTSGYWQIPVAPEVVTRPRSRAI